MAEPKIEVPVEIGGTEAVAGVNRLIKAVEGLERVVDKLGPKVDKTDKEVKKVGESAKKTATEWERFRTSLGGDITTPQAIGDMALRFNAVAAAIQGAGQAMQALGAAAGRGEDNLRATTALGAAYDEVRRATDDTVTAQQAFATQQRLVRSGLQVSNVQLGVITRAARDYARATGTEATQATEQLADALVGASADELQKYGISLQSGLERTEAFAQATRQLAQQQEGTSPAARTLTEDMERLGTAATEAASAFAMMAADGMGLQGVVSGLATRLRTLVGEINDATAASRNAARTEQENSVRQRALEQRRALTGELQARLRASGASEEQIAALAPSGALLMRVSPQVLEAQNIRLREALESSAVSTPASADTISSAFMRERSDARAGTFGTIEGLTADQLRQQLSGDRIRVPEGRLREALARQVAGQAGVAQARQHLIATASTLTEELMWSSATAAGEVMGITGQRRTAASGGTRTDLTTAAMEAAHREAQRLRGTGVSAPTMSTMFEQAQAAREAQQARERAEREAAAGRLGGRIGDTQRAFSEAAADLPGQAGFFDDITGAGEMRRGEMLRMQAEAMRSLVTEVDTRIAQAREQGAAESEINALLSQRVGLVTAVSAADRERAAIERERIAPMKAWRDEMVTGLSSVGNALVESAAAAIEGEEGFSRAMQKQTRAVMVALAKQSAVEVLKNTALSVAAFAGGNVPGGVAYIKAAGLWAATGLAAGGVAAGIGKPPETPSASSAAPPRAASLGPSRAEREAAQPFSLSITVNGALFDGGVERAVIRAIDHSTARGHLPRHLQEARAGYS